MDLKELLGEELYNQVKEQAGDNELAVVSDGNWFPKSKFDAKNQEAKDLQAQIDDRDKQLKDLQKQAEGSEELQNQIKQLQDENKQTKEDYDKRIQKQAFDYELERELSQAEAKNPRAVQGLLDMDKLEMGDDGLKGLREQLDALKESDSYLFKEQQDPNAQQPQVRGRQPNMPPNQQPTGGNDLQKQYDDAVKNGNTAQQIAIKNQMFEQQQNGE